MKYYFLFPQFSVNRHFLFFRQSSTKYMRLLDYNMKKLKSTSKWNSVFPDHINKPLGLPLVRALCTFLRIGWIWHIFCEPRFAPIIYLTRIYTDLMVVKTYRQEFGFHVMLCLRMFLWFSEGSQYILLKIVGISWIWLFPI